MLGLSKCSVSSVVIRVAHREIEEITQNCEEFDTKERREMMETIAENKRLKAELDRLKAEIETPREQRGFS